MQFTFATSDSTFHIDRTDKSLTINGGFAAFSSFLNRSKIIDRLVDTCPIKRDSNNAYPIRDVIITFILTCVIEGKRFRHVRYIQNDEVVKKIFKLDRGVCSDDTIRRFFEAIDCDKGKKWLDQAFEILYSALPEMFIIDWDSTVTTRYGEQDDVEVGYNPTKPGRGSHHPLLTTVAGLRMCLTVNVRPGNVHSANGILDVMNELLDRLPENKRPFAIRADIGFCNNTILKWFEEKHNRPFYVFKLKKTSRVMEAIHSISDAVWDGVASFGAMQITEVSLKLTGWESARRVVLGRRLISKQSPEESGTLFGICKYEYSAIVTNLSPSQFEAWQVVEFYQNRADCENIFDELKNQWGLSGFCADHMNVTELAARFNVLSYNMWSLFVRFFGCKHHKEAKTSRRELLMFPAQLVESGREKTLQIAVADQFWDLLEEGYNRLIAWLKATAPQLTHSNALIDWIKAIDYDPSTKMIEKPVFN